MPSTDLLVRPKRHLWESPVAYVFRVASLNRTHYGTLARQALATHSLAGHPLHEIWQIADYANAARENLRLSMLTKADRPLRMVCPACVREGQPDSLYGERYRYLEYCLRHGCKPLGECPACGIALRYGSGSYGHCECGFELATAHADAGPPEVLRLYRAIAANIPLEMVPTMQELERRDIREINARLQSTWRLLWDEQLESWNVPEGAEITAILPEFGERWHAVSCLLGFAEHRLGRWVTQIGCWWRHGRYRPEVRSRRGPVPPIDLILWRYLRELVRQAVKSGCSGPPVAGTGVLSACIGAGFQCKSRRSGLRGDGLPAPFRTMIGPCTKPFERQPVAAVASSGCRPAGKTIGGYQSVADFNQQAPGGARKVIELVAIGALQPIELVHPHAWRFAAGDVDDLLRQAFKVQVMRLAGGPSSMRSSFDGPHAWLLAPNMTMGRVFAALSFGLLQPLSRPTQTNVWATPFVNPGGMRLDTWAQQAMHDAVLPSLEGRAREAAVLAHSFLGGSPAFHTNELELFCGTPPLQTESIALFPYQSTPLGTGIPKNIAWRQGFLYDSALLETVVKNPQEGLVTS